MLNDESYLIFVHGWTVDRQMTLEEQAFDQEIEDVLQPQLPVLYDLSSFWKRQWKYREVGGWDLALGEEKAESCFYEQLPRFWWCYFNVMESYTLSNYAGACRWGLYRAGNSKVVIAGKRALLKSGSQNLPIWKKALFFSVGGTCDSVVIQKPYPPYPCKAAYAAGSWDARVLPSCFSQFGWHFCRWICDVEEWSFNVFWAWMWHECRSARMKTHMFKKIRKQIARALTLRQWLQLWFVQSFRFFFHIWLSRSALHGYLHGTISRFNVSKRRQREIARGITQEQSRRMRRRKRLELKVKYEDFLIWISSCQSWWQQS